MLETPLQVAFDLSTFPVDARFYTEGRVPGLIVGSIYFVEQDRYQDFLPSEAANLVCVLLESTELISYNGNAYDLLVLEQHHGLTRPCPMRGVHTDIADILAQRNGQAMTFHAATMKYLGEASLNLIEFRKERMLEHDPVHRTDFIAKSHEDIRQTVALWKGWKEGHLA